MILLSGCVGLLLLAKLLYSPTLFQKILGLSLAYMDHVEYKVGLSYISVRLKIPSPIPSLLYRANIKHVYMTIGEYFCPSNICENL